MNLNEHLEKLRYFYEVAKLGSMKKASEAVFITQPSLSKSIKILEEVIGDELFIRMPRGVKLTESGDVLYQYCHELFSSLSDLESKLQFSDDPMAGVLRVGTYDSIGIYFWPKFLASFIPRFPNLSLELATGRSKEMSRLVELGELDLGLVVNPKSSDSLEVEPLYEDHFDFYEATKKKKSYPSSAEAPLLIMPESFGEKRSLEEKLNDMGLGDRKVFKTSSLESLKELCLEGVGIGLLPGLVCRDLVKKKKLKKSTLKVKISRPLFGHEVSLIYPKKKRDNELILNTIGEIKDSFYDEFSDLVS